jgi:hypothetical protein
MSFYKGKVFWRHHQHLWTKFQAAAKFDLRHFVWSYFRSVVFLFTETLKRGIRAIWHLVPRRRNIEKWFVSLKGIRWMRNWRNSSFEMRLIDDYGVSDE